MGQSESTSAFPGVGPAVRSSEWIGNSDVETYDSADSPAYRTPGQQGEGPAGDEDAADYEARRRLKEQLDVVRFHMCLSMYTCMLKMGSQAILSSFLFIGVAIEVSIAIDTSIAKPNHQVNVFTCADATHPIRLAR